MSDLAFQFEFFNYIISVKYPSILAYD